MNVHFPRQARRIFPFTASFGMLPRLVFGSVVEPHRYGSTAFPSPPMIDDASTIVWFRVAQPPGSFAPAAPCTGIAPSDGGPSTTDIAGANTCEFEVAATAIAS